MARTARDQLARSSRFELLAAHRHASELLVASRLLAIASRHDPDIARCLDAGCLLAGIDPEGRMCEVAHRLSGLVEEPTAILAFEAALPRFLAALASSFEAIRTCRQTAHPSGYCWFTRIDGGDGCAEVLRLAHRFST